LHNLHNSHLILVIELTAPGIFKILSFFSLVHKESDPDNFSDPISVLKLHYGYSKPKIWENTNNLIVVIRFICFKYDGSWYRWSTESFSHFIVLTWLLLGR